MRPRARRVAGIALLALSCLLPSGAFRPALPAEGYEIRADRVETEADGDGVRRTYTGRVSAILDSLSIRSEGAVYSSGADEVRFFGDVEGEEPRRRVRADSLVYSLKARTAVVLGNVRVEEGDRELRAERVVLSPSPGRMEATGGVEAVYPEGRARLRADTLVVESGGESGFGRGGIRWTRAEAETLSATGRSVRFWKTGAGTELGGGVTLEVGAWSAACGRAVCESDTVVLEGGPAMQRAAAAIDGVDSVSVTGGRLEIRMAGGAARELMAAGSARIRQARVPGSGGAPILTRMEGDTIRIGVERGILREARSTGSARSVHRDRQGAEMSLEAGRLTVAFEDGRARRVRAEEKARAEHVSGDGAERSRMSADRVEAEMAGERVEAVLLQGRALLEYLPAPRPSGKKGGRDRLTGESIRLGFREGLLVRAAVRGGAMGTYWLSDQERGGN